jgi:hypothetical protein
VKSKTLKTFSPKKDKSNTPSPITITPVKIWIQDTFSSWPNLACPHSVDLLN